MSIRIGHIAPPLAGIVYLPGVMTPQDLSSQALAGWWVALVFYPGDFKLESPRELQAYASLEDKFADEGARIVAASTDSFWSHKAWFESNPLLASVRYPVLADSTQRMSAAYDVLLPDGSARRATFILDPERIVRHVPGRDAEDGHSPVEALRILRALGAGSQSR
jgi:peroxiredoxin (alkyl hydroperoxide reductase subunit C)